MAVIELSTEIHAPVERVFDLARSIDAHVHTTSSTQERAVAGVTSGLIGMDGEVTWEARHFGMKQRLSVRITKFDRPRQFQDMMIKGAFKRMQHDHFFEEVSGVTIMRDRFEFESPLGVLGALVDRFVLVGYMRKFLVERNRVLKALAESPEADSFLKSC